MATIRFHQKGKLMETERLKFCIERFDHYYDSTNNKSAVFLALGTFVLGGLIGIHPYIVENVFGSAWVYVPYYSSAALAISALIIVIWATTPYLTKGVESMYYYGSIASKSMDEFANASEKLDDEEDLADLRAQVSGLATGLSKKFKLLFIAGRLYFFMFIMIAVFSISVLVNLKPNL